MAEPIGPGDWVEAYRGRDCPPVYIGRVYRAVEVWDDPSWGDCSECLPGELAPCVVLAGINTRANPYCGCTLRPIYRRDESLIERLLEPLPADVEPATPDPIAVPVGRAG